MLQKISQENLFPFYLVEGDLATAKSLGGMLGAQVAVLEFEKFSIENARDFINENNLVNENKKIIAIYAKEIPSDAQNALLKITEEPVANTHIFFVIPDIANILPTLRSRAQVLVLEGGEESDKDAQNFLNLKLTEKFEWIVKFIKKNKEEGESSTLVRTETKKLLESIERILYKDRAKMNSEIFETIFKFKSYLATPGASPKMILEHVAIMLS